MPLAGADDTNGVADVFVRELGAQTTERVSVAADGSQGDAASDTPAISADARFVAFVSGPTNLVDGDGPDNVPEGFIRCPLDERDVQHWTATSPVSSVR